MTEKQRVRYIVDAILRDLRTRSGLRQSWDSIEEGVQEQILEHWEECVTRGMTMSEEDLRRNGQSEEGEAACDT